MWRELGAFDGRETIFPADLVQVEDADGHRLTVYTDLTQLEQHLYSSFPGDRDAIAEYMQAIAQFRDIDLLGISALQGLDLVRALARFPSIMKWFPITLDQFATRFKDPFLRRAFPTLQYDFAGIPMAVHLSFVSGCAARTLGWPAGGSLEFSRAIARRYESLGGQIHYRSPVARILVENDRACGVHTQDGTEHRADVVISAADLYSTQVEMLEGRYVDQKMRDYFSAAPDRQGMNLCVSFGVSRDMSAEPHALEYLLPQPAMLDGVERNRLFVEIFNFDPSLAPPGKTTVRVMIEGSYREWREKAQDRENYDAQKAALAAKVIELLEPRFPGWSQQIEMIDVMTPLTVERFTANYHGLQVYPDPKASAMAGFTALLGGFKTKPGPANYYQVGQWATTIGVSTAAISGRKAIMALCKRDGRRFHALDS